MNIIPPKNSKDANDDNSYDTEHKTHALYRRRCRVQNEEKNHLFNLVLTKRFL